MENGLGHITRNLPDMKPGEVWLVGAGPGDPGLLTLHAVNALSQADVIVHDALVSNDCLGLAKPSAEVEYAGKRGGKPSAKQRDISYRLVELAKQGKKVLRLKGGDPFVFGRGGEEALTLVEHGVPFRIDVHMPVEKLFCCCAERLIFTLHNESAALPRLRVSRDTA